MDRELEHLQEMVYEHGYNPATETLKSASAQQQEEFLKQRQELI